MGLALAYAPAASAQKPEAIELDSLERRARIDSADADLQYDLGMGYVWARRYDEAEQAFRRAVAIEPRLAPAHLGLSYLPYLRSEKLWKALMKGKVPREQQPVVEEARRHRRDAYMIDPMVNSGLVIMPWWVRAELSEKEKSKMPPGFFWYRGITLARAGDWYRAQTELEEALARISELAEESIDETLPLAVNEVRYSIAVLEIRQGKLSAAARRLREVLTHDIGMYMAHVRLAEIHERNGAWRSAILERRRALEVAPDDPSLVYDLGVTLARAGVLYEADTVLTRALELNERNPRIPRMAGLVRAQLGDAGRARMALERFLAIAPSRFEAEIEEARARLATLAQQ